MAFRAEVRRALVSPLGGSLTRHFHVPAITALVTDGRDPDHEVVALSELMDALVRVGVPRGRQFVLLAHVAGSRDAVRERCARLRAVLGAPVLAHDPARAGFRPGAFADGTSCDLDDELREAEEVVLVSALRPDAADGVRGGPAALWPGLGTAEARAAFASALPAAGRAGAAFGRSREALALAPAGFALLWDAGDPPGVLAGATADVLDRCAADGWLEPRGRHA